MKYFLIGLSIWFALAWLPAFIKSWATGIRIWWAKKRASRDEQWMYEM